MRRRLIVGLFAQQLMHLDEDENEDEYDFEHGGENEEKNEDENEDDCRSVCPAADAFSHPSPTNDCPPDFYN